MKKNNNHAAKPPRGSGFTTYDKTDKGMDEPINDPITIADT